MCMSVPVSQRVCAREGEREREREMKEMPCNAGAQVSHKFKQIAEAKPLVVSWDKLSAFSACIQTTLPKYSFYQLTSAALSFDHSTSQPRVSSTATTTYTYTIHAIHTNTHWYNRKQRKRYKPTFVFLSPVPGSPNFTLSLWQTRRKLTKVSLSLTLNLTIVRHPCDSFCKESRDTQFDALTTAAWRDNWINFHSATCKEQLKFISACDNLQVKKKAEPPPQVAITQVAGNIVTFSINLLHPSAPKWLQ